MKPKNIIQEVLASIKIALRFGRQHNATLSMLEGVYVRQPLNKQLLAGLDTILTVAPNGSLYQVTRTDYINNEPEVEQTWLAAYGWHSNGHLIEIGGDRYCIFDTVTKSLYLEELTDSGRTTLELFTKSYKSYEKVYQNNVTHLLHFLYGFASAASASTNRHCRNN